MEKLQLALEKARREREAAIADRADPAARERAPGSGDAGDSAGARELTRSPATKRRQRLGQARLVAADPEDMRADIFRVLRTRVMQRLNAMRQNTMAVLSPGRAEGKTLIASNLAISMAQQLGRETLLVDVDLRRPSIHRCFDLPEGPGLTDYLTGKCSLASCIVDPGIPQLSLLPQYKPVRDSSELLATPRMAELAQQLKRQNTRRVVIYDLPPLLLTDDALVFVRYVDTSLLIVKEGNTKRRDLERALELLDGQDLLGTVLNDSRHDSSAYYYGTYHRGGEQGKSAARRVS